MKLNFLTGSSGRDRKASHFDKRCPACERSGQYTPVLDEHWFACHADRFCWRAETPPVPRPKRPTNWQSYQNWRQLLGYGVVESPHYAAAISTRLGLFDEVVRPPKVKHEDGEPGNRAGPRVYVQFILPPIVGCPICGEMAGYVNIGSGSWFFCSDHRCCWFAGERVLLTYLDEDRSVWKANHKFLRGFCVITDDGGLMPSSKTRPGPDFEHIAPTVETLLEPVSMLPSAPPSLGLWEAADRVLMEAWSQERRRYAWCPRSEHVFCDLWRLRHALRRVQNSD